jgi:alcohol dehydrogenase class IV
MTGAPHGAVCAALLAPVVAANLARAESSVRTRYTEVAQWLTGDPGASAEDGLAWITGTVGALGIAALSSYGLGPAQADEVVAGAARASSMQGNPVRLDVAELHAIYRAAL